MKLLLDQNLSARLIAGLRPTYPDSAHVGELGLERATDRDIWESVRQHGYAILTKDADFLQLSFLHGHPPRVIWVNLGNCSTEKILAALHEAAEDIAAFDADEGASLLSLM